MKTAAKDFKMTELGPIPKDWGVKRLGDVTKRRKHSAGSALSARGEGAHAENAENAEVAQ